MSFSKYDICSMALTNLRANTISSFMDGSNEGEICGIFYDAFIKDIFSRYPWSFALKKRLLSQDSTDPVNEFTYRHILPAECERLWSVYSSSAVGATKVRDYDILERYIQSDYDTLYGEYTYYVSEATWPGYFIQYATSALAAAIAMPVSDSQELADRWQVIAYGTPQEQEKGGKFLVAAQQDMAQKPFDMMPVCEIITARFG
ncbi:MAG: hypothetical protein HGA87_05285 [Desulfobulbaceae bacterium]|nr:hypothetical protein [Desulfobulbaceae bacterium]